MDQHSANNPEEHGGTNDDTMKDESDAPANGTTTTSDEIGKTNFRVGGSDCLNGKPAYALLTGVWINNDEESDSRGEEIGVNIPILNLPVVLGRRWVSKDKDMHHVALPRDEKLLSRLHACIFYRDDKGGKLGRYEIIPGVEGGSSSVSNRVIYKPFESNSGEQDETFDPDSIYRLPHMKQSDPLPKNGFFAIECLGRHTIKVGDKRVTKGKQAMLMDGIPIQIASYSFYFLLPKDAPPISQTFKYPVKKGQTPITEIKDSEPTKPVQDKNNPVKEFTPANEPPLKKVKKQEESYTAKLDNITTENLISQLKTATQSEEWTKNDQLVSATLGMRIAREAAKDSKIQQIAREQHGVTQRDIIDWYNAHTLFSDFERLMLSKIEYKSYQSSITKAILRAGYTRNESNPGKSRCTRWDLPPDIPLEPASPKPHSKSPRRGNDGSVEKSGDVVKSSSSNSDSKAENEKNAPGAEGGGPVEIKSSATLEEDIPLSHLEKSLSS